MAGTQARPVVGSCAPPSRSGFNSSRQIRGRQRVPAAQDTCWPSSCWPPVSGCWMCSASSAPGVRPLATRAVNKNDPNDARSVAVAALRSASCQEVRRDDHAAVLQVWSKRHQDLGSTRTQVACRLHAVWCELPPGGVSRRITAGQAARILGSITRSEAVADAAALEPIIPAAGKGDVQPQAPLRIASGLRLDFDAKRRSICRRGVESDGTDVADLVVCGPHAHVRLAQLDRSPVAAQPCG
jgi:hypothetical protein